MALPSWLLKVPDINLYHPSFSDSNLSSSLKMNKSKTCREIFLLINADNNSSDEEFVPLYDSYRSKNPDFGYQSYDVSDPENMNSADWKAQFRVEKAELPRLADSWHDGMLVLARLPPSISSVFPNNYSVPFILLGGKRYCENEVFCSGTQHKTRSGLEPRPLETKSSALPIGPSRP